FIYDLIIHAYLMKDIVKINQEQILNYLELFKENIDLTKNKKRLVSYHLYKGLFHYKIDPSNNITFSNYLRALEILRENFGEKHPLYNSVYIYIIKYLFYEGKYLLTLDYVQKAFENITLDFNSNGSYENPEPSSFYDYDPVFIHLSYKIQSFLHLYIEENNMKFLLLAKQNADYTLSLIEKLKWKYDHENHKYYISEAETEIFKIAEKINYDLYKKTGEEHYKNKAFELNERSKAFTLLINLRTEEAMEYGGIPSELIQQEAEIIQKISAFTEFILEEENLENPDKNKLKNWENALFRLNQEHDKLIEFFENNYPDYYRLKYDTRVMSSGEVQKKLDKDEVLLEYSLTDSILFTYVISPDKTEIFQEKVDSGFRKLCLDFYKVITKQSFSYGVRETFKQYVEKGHDLYNILIRPIEPSIEGKNIILIPDGEISYVSFEALLTRPVDGDHFNYYHLPYLVLDHGFSNSFSATVHFSESGKKFKTTKDVLAFAPSYSNINAQNIGFELLRQSDREQLIRIPGVKEEVRKISGFMNADVYEDFAATESNFKQKASNYKVLHLAMHTILDDKNPLYSKLAFTQMVDSLEDGFLHTYEIYNMQINADLAVLSSCNSGFGELQEGEGIQSLARGFAYAGCPSILMTLWEVADNSTVEIMEKFYFYLDKGYSKNEALRQSKIDFLSNADHLKSNPFFWSSFVLVGDTRPIYLKESTVVLMNIGILLLPMPLLWFFYRRYRKIEQKILKNQS
ncbi:MAG: CHAT domain-containing protein, partial [Bacteroidota bacterium]